MKVLFYVDPFINIDAPRRLQVTYQFAHNLATILKATGKAYEFIFLGDPYSRKSEVGKYFTFSPFTPSDIQKILVTGKSAHQISADMFSRKLSSSTSKAYQNIIKDKLGDFEPDVIFSWQSFPEIFEDLFPKALLLAKEAGFMNLPPYALSFSFDPFGYYKEGYTKKFSNELMKTNMDKEARLFMERYRAFFEGVFVQKKSLGKQLSLLKKKFGKVVLLPLQVSGHPSFDCQGDFKNQKEYLYYVLQMLPKDIAVVVTEHYQTESIFIQNKQPTSFYAYCQRSFDNFFYFPELAEVPNVSQYILPYVDGLITVSSNLGFQSAFFQKPVCVIGDSQLTGIAACKEVSEFGDVLEKRPKVNLDHFLYPLITRYYIPATKDYLFNPSWFYNFLERSYDKKKAYPFFEEIDTPSVLYKNLLKAAQVGSADRKAA